MTMTHPSSPQELQAPSLGLRLKSLVSRIAIKLYLPSIIAGLAKTFEYMVRPKSTVEYPEQRLKVRPGYRGEHRLKKDETGAPKCVACFMCQTSCPAECIEIVAKPSDRPGRDKEPASFRIDLLKCIYCGMCEEACPCDAIELTTTYTQVATTREEKVYDLERLLRN
jgi:NADH-quinone oxidoreductase subunit I